MALVVVDDGLSLGMFDGSLLLTGDGILDALGPSVGVSVSRVPAINVGTSLGILDGTCDGESLSTSEGESDALGTRLGSSLFTRVGPMDALGPRVGKLSSRAPEMNVGKSLGALDGNCDGTLLFISEGASDALGTRLGASLSDDEGELDSLGPSVGTLALIAPEIIVGESLGRIEGTCDGTSLIPRDGALEALGARLGSSLLAKDGVRDALGPSVGTSAITSFVSNDLVASDGCSEGNVDGSDDGG